MIIERIFITIMERILVTTIERILVTLEYKEGNKHRCYRFY